MSNFTIKELSEFSGIKQHTIRIWEQRFNFLTPKRAENYRRLYNTDELNIFLDVILLIQSGYKISQVAGMTTEEKIDNVSNSNHDQYTLKTINELIICMAEMDVERFELVLNSAILYIGVHEMIREVIVPFCDKVGLFQRLDGKSYIENLLVVKEVIRQKIYSGIEKIGLIRDPAKMIVLFEPTAEPQDLPLLYLNYLFQLEGFRCLYLANDIQVDTLDRICAQKKPDYVVTVLLSKNAHRDLIEFVDHMPVKHPRTSFISVGNPLMVKSNGSKYKSFNQVTEAVNYMLHKA